MKKYTCALMAVCALFGSPAYARDPRVTEAWEDACTYSRYDCTGVKPPSVRETTYIAEYGFLGLYFGSNTVWIVPGMSKTLRHAVIAHEMVHYLQMKVDGQSWDDPAFARCEAEREAFAVADIVLKRLDPQSKQIRNGDLSDYGACQHPEAALKVES